MNSTALRWPFDDNADKPSSSSKKAEELAITKANNREVCIGLGLALPGCAALKVEGGVEQRRGTNTGDWINKSFR